MDGRAPAQGSWGFFQGSSGGGDFIRVRDVGADPPNGTPPGNIPTWGRKMDNRETAEETGGGRLRIPTTGDSERGGGL